MPSILPSGGGAQSMIEQQIKRWRLLQARNAPGPAKPPAPVITISREFGSQGAALGGLVANELGFSLWDQEIVHAIAQRTGAAEHLLSSLDEQSRSTVDELVLDTFRGPLATETEYVRQLVRVFHTLARHGGAVIIGRGAQFVLGPDQALRVRVFAPLELRAQGFAARENLDPKAAAREVKRQDRDRVAFIRQQFGQDVADPHHYDLLVNTASIPLDVAARVVAASYRAKHGAPAQRVDASR